MLLSFCSVTPQWLRLTLTISACLARFIRLTYALFKCCTKGKGGRKAGRKESAQAWSRGREVESIHCLQCHLSDLSPDNHCVIGISFMIYNLLQKCTFDITRKGFVAGSACSMLVLNAILHLQNFKKKKKKESPLINVNLKHQDQSFSAVVVGVVPTVNEAINHSKRSSAANTVC